MLSAIGIASAGLAQAGARLETAARNVVSSGAQASNAINAQINGSGSAPSAGGATPATAIAAQESGSLSDAFISFKEAELSYKFQTALLGRLHDIEADFLKTFD